MKLLYIGESSLDNIYQSIYKSFGIEILHYRNPLKAIDNLVELRPDFVFMIKDDYPRFWKIVLTSLREIYSSTQTSFILKGELDNQEITAFNYLKGSYNLTNTDEVSNIKQYLVEYIGHNSISNTYFPLERELCISFVKPDDFSFVTGNIIELNSDKIIFTLDNREETKGILIGEEINNASINLSDTVITVDISILSVTNKIICRVINGLKDYGNLTSSLFA